MHAPTSRSTSFWGSAIVFACIMAGLLVASLYNFLLFHTLAELFSILIGASIFLIAWNSRERLDNQYFLFLGMAYLAVAVLDLLHTLAYKGMGVFPARGANLPTQIWIATRYLESLSLLIAPVFLTRRGGLAAGGAVWALGLAVLLSLFWWGVFPDCFVEGRGLTRFKVVSEYLICLILAGAGLFLYLRRSFFDRHIFLLLAWSLGVTIFSELCFTFYVSVYGLSNLVGHFLKLVSFYLVYRALIITGFRQPQEVLYSELEQSRQALQRSESLLQSTSHIAKIGGWEMEADGGKMSWTEGARRLFAMPPEHDPSPEEALARFHPEDRPQLARALAAARQEGAPFDLELRLKNWEGQELWLRCICRPVSERGQVVKLEGAFQDITARKLSEAQIQRQQIALGTQSLMLQERVRELACLFGVSQAANEVANQKELFERTLGLVPQGWQHPENTSAVIVFDQQTYGQPLDAATHHKLESPIEVDGQLRGGLAVYARHAPPGQEEDSFLPEKRDLIFDLARTLGRVVPALEAKRIQERARQELEAQVAEQTAELRQANQELERSNQELQQFAYVASHDLQEPLRMVSSYVQLLQRRYQDKLDQDANDFIGFAVDGAMRMKALIQDLLTFSRVTTRGGEMELIDSGDALDRALANLRTLLTESGARVSRGPLPRMVADPGQLAQVFQNLVQNAVKFRGPDSPRISVEAENIDGQWRFAVSDNGVGIEPRYFDRIFIIYQRLASRADLGGTGIGLALVKKIVERHGGRVWVDSSPGRGSIFYFTIAEQRGGP